MDGLLPASRVDGVVGPVCARQVAPTRRRHVPLGGAAAPRPYVGAWISRGARGVRRRHDGELGRAQQLGASLRLRVRCLVLPCPDVARRLLCSPDVSQLSDRYGLKMEALREAYLDENVDYAYRQAWQGAIGTSALVGAPAVLLDVDMHTVTDAELFGWSRTVSLPKKQESEAEAALSALPVGMLCGWFDVRFCAGGDAGEGEGDGGSSSCVELSTSPKAPYTHWAQTTLVLDPPLAPGGQLAVGLTQLKRSHHDLNLTLTYVPDRMTEEVSASYAITAECAFDAPPSFKHTSLSLQPRARTLPYMAGSERESGRRLTTRPMTMMTMLSEAPRLRTMRLTTRWASAAARGRRSTGTMNRLASGWRRRLEAGLLLARRDSCSYDGGPRERAV